MLQTPKNSLKRAWRILPWVFRPPNNPFKEGISKLVRWAHAARKEGLLGLEHIADSEKDRFARKGLQLLVDGSEPEVIRRIMEAELIIDEQRDLDAMGLIHVMRNLADPEQLGPGIAVAFVATIYGVALANLLFIPIANKLRMCINERSQYRELMVEGIISIADGENPRSIELKLNGYLH